MSFRHLFHSTDPARSLVTAVASAALLLAASAQARDEDRKSRPRGYVDGSAFAEFATEDGLQVEVSLEMPLLGILAQAVAAEDQGAGKLLRQIEALNAVIVGVEDRIDEARKMVRRQAERLKKDGWDQLAKVRDDENDISVLILADDEVIKGLVVLVVTSDDDGQLVFANLAGDIDMSTLGSLVSGFNLSALNKLSQIDWKEYEKKNGGAR